MESDYACQVLDMPFSELLQRRLLATPSISSAVQLLTTDEKWADSIPEELYELTVLYLLILMSSNAFTSHA